MFISISICDSSSRLANAISVIVKIKRFSSKWNDRYYKTIFADSPDISFNFVVAHTLATAGFILEIL